MGRPTKYSPEILQKAEDYLENYKTHGDLIPSIAGLACAIDIGRRTIHTWANEDDKAEFQHILDKISLKQEKLLVTNGLSGEFNSAITKLVLGKHGYHEKVDNTLAGPDGGPVRTESKTLGVVGVTPGN